ncbi:MULTISPECIES: hypothetical protein [Pseudomonas]|uniref:hypothetical protein n=1 Tax=Pseudomonas TaxID=286 RepID=UPI00123A6ADB|nr:MULTISPECIES: hypothetical protein [Pseudomonas]QIB50182.1 hypothetical protein G3M63_03330 [Pseudomonas sp. OIL-1]
MSFSKQVSAARKEAEKEAHHLGSVARRFYKGTAKESSRDFRKLQKRARHNMHDMHLGGHNNRASHSLQQAGQMVKQHPVVTLAIAAGAFALVAYFLTKPRRQNSHQAGTDSSQTPL